MNIINNQRTFYKFLEIDNIFPEANKILCLPFYVSTIELEITYNYTEKEQATQDRPSEPAKVEIIDINVVSALLVTDKKVNISETANIILSSMVYLNTPTDIIETLCFEDADDWFTDRYIS